MFTTIVLCDEGCTGFTNKHGDIRGYVLSIVGGFNCIFNFNSMTGMVIQSDEHIVSTGSNHQPVS